MSLPEAWVGEIEPVHDLVVFVIRGLAGVARERIHIGPFEVNYPASLFIKERVLGRIIKIVRIPFFVGMGDDFAGPIPRSFRPLSFCIPDYAEHGLSQGLRRDHNIAPTELVPETGAVA